MIAFGLKIMWFVNKAAGMAYQTENYTDIDFGWQLANGNE